MACRLKPDQCRAQHVAPRLSGAVQDGTDWDKATCPSCGHGTFRVSAPDRARYRHIWGCACKGCRCNPVPRAGLLKLGVMPGCLGGYLLSAPAVTDPMAAATLREMVDLILSWPGVDPSQMRLMLAEARGDKIPEQYGECAKFGQGIGMSRAHSFRMAAKLCRPSDSSSCPEGGVVDT